MGQDKLRGIFAMLVTPLNRSNEEIDYEALRAEIDWCVEQGVDGVVATPSIGEFACLTKEERWKCFEVVADQVSKHPGIIKIGTIAAAYSKEVVEHAKVCLELGYAGAQLIPPYYWIPEEDEVYSHFKTAADTGLPIVAYHNPALSKVYMSRPFIGRIADIEGVIAIKEVKTDRHRELESLYKEVADKISVFHTFRVFTTGLLLGSSGGFINAFAVPACVKMWKLFNEGKDRQRMEDIQIMVNEVFPRGGEDNKRHIGTTKLVTSAVSGIDMGPPRAPYMLPEAHVNEALKKTLPQLEALLKG